MRSVDSVLERAALTLGSRSLADAGNPVLLMVSGGSDSTALAYVANELLERDLIGMMGIMHVNHCLRGSASDADAAFVQNIAEALNVPFFLYTIDVGKLARDERDNLEAVARRERYGAAQDALEKLCRFASEPMASGRIFTAHTQNDRVENFYMRSIVGTGPGGFRSMLYRNGAVCRPLLDTNREELRDYLRRRAIDAEGDPTVVAVKDEVGGLWREDATNAHTDQFRGYVRNRIIPLAQARNPQLLSTLCRSMNLIADEDDMLDDLAQNIVVRCAHWVGSTRDGEVDFSRGCRIGSTFGKEPIPLQRRAMVYILQQILGLDARVETHSVEVALSTFSDGKPISGFTGNIQGNLALSANKRGLLIEPMEAYRARRKRRS